MKKNIILFFLVLNSAILFAQNTDTLINRYIAIKNALVESKSNQAKNAITNFNSAVLSDSTFKISKEMQSALNKLRNANTIEAQRENFNAFSISFWDMLKTTKYSSQVIYYQYCPMKKAYWLSLEKKIENPYYGSSMLSCGRVVEKTQ